MDQTARKNNKISLAIVGGGIAGVCVALGILNHAPHIRIHIFEAAPRFQEIGAGVAFGINAQRALDKLDSRAGEAYRRIASRYADPRLDSTEQGQIQTYVRLLMGIDHRTNPDYRAGTEVCEVFTQGGLSSVHRARFLDSMVALLPDEVRKHCVSFGHRLVNVEDISRDDGTGVKLIFDNGYSAAFDAVIGCDGIRSSLRKIILADEPELAEPVFTGKYAYRGLIPTDQAATMLGDRLVREATHHVGYGGHVLTFPIDHGKTVNVVAFRSKPNGRWDDDQWVKPTTKDEMDQDFEGWGANVKAILSKMKTSDKWALFDHPPASTYHRAGRICLIGDSAHASTPHQGAGAGLAVEDAVVLARLLGNVQGREDLEPAFREFELLRKDRTQRLVRCSREQGAIFDFEGEGIRDDIRKMAESMPSRWDWIWHFNV